MHQSRSNELNGAGKGALLLLPAADFAWSRIFLLSSSILLQVKPIFIWDVLNKFVEFGDDVFVENRLNNLKHIKSLHQRQCGWHISSDGIVGITSGWIHARLVGQRIARW
jgi:hypothetical protein